MGVEWSGIPVLSSRTEGFDFAAAFDRATLGLVIADSQGRIVRVNDAYARLVDRTAEELIGRDSSTFTHPDDREMNRLQVQRGDRGSTTFEKRYIRKDGTIVWARITLSPAYDQDGIRYLIGTAEDVTEQKRVREELVETRRKVSSALIAGEIATYEWDVHSDRLWGDANFDQIFGTERDADGTAPLSRFVNAIHPDDREHVRAAIALTVETGAEYDVEYRVMNGGLERWVSARGRIERIEPEGITRFHGVVLDITARKRAEQQAQRLSRLYSTFLSGTDDLAYLIDREGRFIFANRALLALWGMSLDEVSGKTLYDLGYPKWHADMNMREFAQVFETKKTIRGEVPYTSPTGVSGVYEYVFSPVLDENGEVEVIAGTSRDVSEKRKVQEAVRTLLDSERAARAEAERASRMKDEFLATLSHELRTPLSAVLGWAQILGNGTPSVEEVREGIEVIGRNARAQAQIIEDLLEMSRIISGKIRLDVQPVRLDAIVRAAVATVQNAADAKRVRIRITSDDDGQALISGDANRLQQVFWNLLSNAVKFTPEDGHIEVSLARRDARMEVAVRDSGEGIRPEFLPFVFDRFRQADSTTTRRHSGLGLGLAIVKQLVELHGGSVGVTSEGEGKGSTFTVLLPPVVPRQETFMDERRDGGAKLAIAATARERVAGVRVLVVDDEPDARGVTRRFLEECSAVVTTATSSREALAALEEQLFDVLVSDVGMPDEDGYSLIRKIRDRGIHIPAVALTAYARPEDRVRAALAGFQSHVSKPADPAELISIVATLAGRA